MTDETKPASEAEVVEAMAKVASPGAFRALPVHLAAKPAHLCEWMNQQRDAEALATRALTAARALGVMMPEEAAGQRKAWEAALAALRADRDETRTERDNLAARVRVMEEALVFYGGHDPDNSDMGNWLEKMNDDFGETARAALSTEPARDEQ